MTEKKKVSIVGATGYTGQELVRIIVSHPSIEVAALTSRKNHGEEYTKLFPRFAGYSLPPITAYQPRSVAKQSDLIFFCLPHAESQEPVAKALESGAGVVDLSADFRLRKVNQYKKWYGPHKKTGLLKSAVYGLPELYRSRIKRAKLVANPGCYPTGVILAAAPFFKAGIADHRRVIADMKSGVSGAGRKANLVLSFCEVNEGFRPYNLYSHRHTPEMEQELSRVAGKKTSVTFSPHLAPMNRGILGTIYLILKKKYTESHLRSVLVKAYAAEPFMRVLEPGDLPCVSRVRSTNFVDLAVNTPPEGREATVTVAFDNLVKGASGAAVQNMNLMLKLPETEGLLNAPLHP